MIELAKFRLGAVANQPSPFKFERASVQVLAKHQRRQVPLANLPLQSEWRDPVVFRRGQA